MSILDSDYDPGLFESREIVAFWHYNDQLLSQSVVCPKTLCSSTDMPNLLWLKADQSERRMKYVGMWILLGFTEQQKKSGFFGLI